MKRDVILKMAASTMVFSTVLTGCAQFGSSSVASISSKPASTKDGARYAKKAEKAMAKGETEYNADVAAVAAEGLALHQLGVHDLRARIADDVRGSDGALGGALDAQGRGAVAVQAHEQLLDVEDDVGDVLDHARQGRELMTHALDDVVGHALGLRDLRQAIERVPQAVPQPINSIDPRIHPVLRHAQAGCDG